MYSEVYIVYIYIYIYIYYIMLYITLQVLVCGPETDCCVDRRVMQRLRPTRCPGRELSGFEACRFGDPNLTL